MWAYRTFMEENGRPRLDLILNRIAADIAPNPRFKRWILRGMESNEYVGRQVILSPGVRIEGSHLGDHTGFGISAHIRDAVIEEDVRVGSNALIEACRVGRNTVVAANSIVSEDVPPNSVAYGTNRVRPLNQWTEASNRAVSRRAFTRSPCWDWSQLGKAYGTGRLIRSVVEYAITNYLPILLNPTGREKPLPDSVETDGEEVTIDRSACIDPLFPEAITLHRNVRLGRRTVLLSHSGVNIRQDVFETGPTEIGENTWVGDHTVILPGTAVPPDLQLPPHSVATTGGVYVVPSNEYVPYGDL